MARQPKIYATVAKRFSLQALTAMGFVRDGSRLVKRGAMRRVRAVATSLDDTSWRVTPHERGWRK